MAGIASYFHGERGVVVDRWWGWLSKPQLAFHIALSDDPHRSLARDYDSDIGIDPLLAAGDTAVYLRLDGTSGIWVRAEDQHGRALDDAIGRVRESRQWMTRWKGHQDSDDELRDIVQQLLEATGEAPRIEPPQAARETPSTAATFFLSYSSGDSLLARQVRDELAEDARLKVWFDLAQPEGAAPAHDRGIAAWLEQSVYGCEGFVLLLTQSALDSAWVQREIEFALRHRAGREGLRLLVLKAQDIAVPAEIAAVATVIELQGLWWSRGLSEELFAAAYARPGRRAWLAQELSRAGPEGESLRYEQLGTESGTVVSFHWATSPSRRRGFRERDLRWSLVYRPRAGGTVRVSGGGEGRPADLDMKAGDKIAFMGLHRRCGVSLAKALPLWMRSADLEVGTDRVLDRYFDALGVDTAFQPTRRRLRKSAIDAWERLVAGLRYQGPDGLWRGYDDLVWALLRTGGDSRTLLAQISTSQIEWAKR